jgi:hypothetical protein
MLSWCLYMPALLAPHIGYQEPFHVVGNLERAAQLFNNVTSFHNLPNNLPDHQWRVGGLAGESIRAGCRMALGEPGVAIDNSLISC